MAEEEYNIDQILEKRFGASGSPEYLVLWELGDETWEPLDRLYQSLELRPRPRRSPSMCDAAQQPLQRPSVLYCRAPTAADDRHPCDAAQQSLQRPSLPSISLALHPMICLNRTPGRLLSRNSFCLMP